MRVINEEFLRVAKLEKGSEIAVDANDIVTPMAKDYARINKIKFVCHNGAKISKMPMDTHNFVGGVGRFVDYITGVRYGKKPEDMTHIRGNLLVKKNHPRIVFRGLLDALEAKIIEVQCIAYESANQEIVDNLEEVLGYVRKMLGAEVKEAPFSPPKLFNLSEDELKKASHSPMDYCGIDHILPSYKYGKLFAGLNTLRTEVRKTELQAITTFQGSRQDIILALNRLSSAIYLLELKVVASR